MKKIPVIFFLGKPGSGKDTQAELLVKKFRFVEISSGGMLRKLKDRANDEPDNYEAHGVKTILNNAKFVPALTVASLWYKVLLDIAQNVAILLKFHRELYLAEAHENYRKQNCLRIFLQHGLTGAFLRQNRYLLICLMMRLISVFRLPAVGIGMMILQKVWIAGFKNMKHS